MSLILLLLIAIEVIYAFNMIPGANIASMMHTQGEKSAQIMVSSAAGLRIRRAPTALFGADVEEGETNVQYQDDEHPLLSLGTAYLYLGLLFLVFTCNQTARQVVYYICDFSNEADAMRYMNVALDFTREQYAALASFGFTVTFASTSLVAGGVADKRARNLIAGMSCAAWSAATLLQGQATSYAQVLPLRSFVGFAQAFYNPAAYTLLAEYFPSNMMAQVNGIFTSGIYLGGAFSSLAIFLDERIGWRGTLTTIGAVGLALAMLLVVTLPEPRSSGERSPLAIDSINNRSSARSNSGSVHSAEKDNQGGLGKIFSGFASVLTSVGASTEAQLLLGCTALRYCAGFTIGIWKAPFIYAKFPGAQEVFAGSNAAIIAVAGIFSCIVGGIIADKLANPEGSSRQPIARTWVPAVGSLLAVPMWVLFCKAPTTQLTFVWLFLEVSHLNPTPHWHGIPARF